jgi:hypothetical protein
VFVAVAFAFAPWALADGGVVADCVAVRYTSPETGGVALPRFLTAREVGFGARLESATEGVAESDGASADRFVRLAIDRLVARKMLASLLVQRGLEPTDLPQRVLDARADLVDRVGGEPALTLLMRRDGIEADELSALLRDQVRATWYVDKAISPIATISEDALREAHRSLQHPFRTLKFEDARRSLARWLLVERMRAAELEFLQSARPRIKVALLSAASRP